MMDPDEIQMIELDEEGQPIVQKEEMVFDAEDGQEHSGFFEGSLTRIDSIPMFPASGDFSARVAELQAKIRDQRVLEPTKNAIRRVAAIPEVRIGEMPAAPTYPKHPVCGHEMDDTIKYTRRSTHAILDEKTGYPRYNELIPCFHCTEDIRRSRNAKVTKRNIEALFGGANIPKYAENWNFTTVPSNVDKHAVQAMLYYTDSNIEKMGKGKAGVNIFLHGEPGSGKTSLAISALRRYMESGIACFLVNMPEYFNLVYRGMSKYAPPELARLEESVMNVPVAVLDDFSAENPTSDILKRLLLLIEYRTARGLTTHVTSNNSLEVLETYWHMPNLGEEVQQQSGRILRRLRERFNVVHVAPRGENT